MTLAAIASEQLINMAITFFMLPLSSGFVCYLFELLARH